MPMTQEIQTEIIVILPLALQLIGLSFAVQVDSYISREHRRMMRIIIAVVISLIVCEAAGFLLEAYDASPLAHTLCSLYGYAARPAVIVLFFYLVRGRKNHWPAWTLAGINAAVYATALFSRVCFWFGPDGHFHRGPLSYTCHAVSGFLLACLLYQTIRTYGGKGKAEAGIPVFSALLIVVSTLLDTLVPPFQYFQVSLLLIALVSSCVFYYIWLHLQFVREHEDAIKAEQRIQIMISQIQPHFMYNTLSTIQALCRIDPEKAFDTVEKFGQYLRQNIDSLNQSGLIPFDKEMEHTRIYAEIEMLRFPSIHMEYDLEDTDFSLPALTVQPLVENAIRHGVRIRSRGTVTVSTRREGDGHVIVIRDNGRGFDADAAVQADASHIGLRNVRDRIKQLCGGDMTIESTIGQGTAITLRIPAGKEAA